MKNASNTKTPLTQNQIDSFFEVVDSLKKYRRAEIEGKNGKSIVKDLYVDLLPNNQILHTCETPNTTFLIGRKGTGKSTIFKKIESDFVDDKTKITCYIDVKTVYEQNKSNSFTIDYLSETIPEEILKKYLLERAFIQEVLKSIIDSIEKKYESFIKKLLFSDLAYDVQGELKKLQNKLMNNECLKSIELPVISSVSKTLGKKEEKEENSSVSSSINANTSTTPTISLNLQTTESDSEKKLNSWEQTFSDIFLKVFEIKEFLLKIKEILLQLHITTIYVLLDDFSELDQESSIIFVESILAPLNNWSEEFIKFKIATYPNRIYYGDIDPTKIDKVFLDFYELYSKENREIMEERSIDFTKRLLENRIQFYCKSTPDIFFDLKNTDMNTYYKLLFQVSMNVPRCLGYILFYCYQNTLVSHKYISVNDIEKAAQIYYENHIECIFEGSHNSLSTYNEKLTIVQQKALLDLIIDNLKNIKQQIKTGKITGQSYSTARQNPYVSHFYCDKVLENLLSTLELNYFISKYDELSDRDSKKVSIYAINYGLAKKLNLKWGKPEGFRKYFIERPFNLSQNIQNFINNTKDYECTNPNCKQKFPYSQKDKLEFFGFICPKCHSKVELVTITTILNQELFENDISKNSNTLLNSQWDYTILKLLNSSSQEMSVVEMCEELDLSPQLIGIRAKSLEQDGFVIRTKSMGRRFLKITEKAKKHFF